MNNFNQLLLAVYLLFSIGTAHSQGVKLPNERVFSKSQMEEDLGILYSSLTNYHPVPFLYTPEAEFKAFYEAQKAALPDSLSEREFYLLARQMITLVKCGHTSGRIAPSWTKLTGGQPILLPFDIMLVDDKAYFKNTVEGDFSFGIRDELLRINEVPIQEILQQMALIQSRDGNTSSFVKAILTYRFRDYYFFLYGPQPEMRLEFRTQAGDIKTAKVAPTNKKMKEARQLVLPDNLSVVYKNTWSVFAIDSSSNVAYLKIKSFSDRKDHKKYYEQVFKRLQQLPNAQLVIDLRDNPGGYFKNGNRLLGYLTPNKFEFNFQRPKRKIEKNEFTKMGKWNKLTKAAFSVKPSKHRVKGQRTYTFTFKPRKPQYTGKAHVITNGITFSQASLAAAHLHQYGAVMYGSETGGTETNTNAMTQYELTLPHAGIKVTIPYYQVISNSTKGSFGNGVKPTHELKPGTDLTEDAILLDVMGLIKTNQQGMSKE